MLRWSQLCMILLASGMSGCGAAKSDPFEREYDLTIRAALGNLSDDQRQQLLQENHPILLQLADPALNGLLRLFAELPASRHAELRRKLFLKWRFSDLDRSRQIVFEQVLKMNSKVLNDQEVTSQAELAINMLRKCDVGLAVVEIPDSGEKMVSCFVIWPEKLFPTWVTIVNASATRNKAAIEAHIVRLPMMKTLAYSELPMTTHVETERPHT